MEYTFRIRYFKSDNCKVLSTSDKEWECKLAPWGSTDVYCEGFTIFYFYLNKLTPRSLIQLKIDPVKQNQNP